MNWEELRKHCGGQWKDVADALETDNREIFRWRNKLIVNRRQAEMISLFIREKTGVLVEVDEILSHGSQDRRVKQARDAVG